MGDIISIISDVRNRSEEYNTNVISMRSKNIELTMSPRIKIANWNISVSNWLRISFYQRF